MNKKDAIFTAYDDFRVVGASVEDDLETGKGWRYIYEPTANPPKRESAKGGLVDASELNVKAAKGRRFVLIDGEHHYVHRVEMKKGERVTITLKARAVETN